MAEQIFFNRELSWIEFNARVLAEAERQDVPLLERLRFLNIVSANFDEFFMVRVAGLKRQEQTQPHLRDISGLTAQEQLERISQRAHEVQSKRNALLNTGILPELARSGIVYVPRSQYSAEQRLYTENLFSNEIFPLLTPLRTDTKNSLPELANQKLHAAFLLAPLFNPQAKTTDAEILSPFMHAEKTEPAAIVQVPSCISRVIWLQNSGSSKVFTLLDDIIELHGTKLFPGYKVLETMLFKVTRDADFSVDEERELDFIQAMEEVLEERRTSIPTRLTCSNTSPHLTRMLAEKLRIESRDIYTFDGILDFAAIDDIAGIDGFDHLKYSEWKPIPSPEFNNGAPIWETIAAKDVLLHVPFESFDPVISFIKEAAEDPDVLAIKMTLYRTSGDSPIIHALKKAARSGKQVTAFVELKARFSEQQNIDWAAQLEHAGVIVVYGIMHLKVHAKLALVIRREHAGIKRYVHLSTGNYNEKTAQIYADLSLFTANNETANDATVFFNMISGYSAIQTMKKLVMAPVNLKSKLIALIERETALSTPETPGLIMAKMNSLGEPDIIHALYKANRANVRIMLNVRGICMLVPGVKNISDNITVTSVIDRFLEHSRIFYFQNGGAEELYLSSADWLDRNLNKRVELMFPVEQEDLFRRIKDILDIYFKDTASSFTLLSSGEWKPNAELRGKHAFQAQKELRSIYRRRSKNTGHRQPFEFTVRRRT
ncbi:MAG: polyphosphate kinase 1 [Bacteroides sp.]|nr:polyphosphate kinase 1 [Prevotella sp.]MCM1407127.1 polyphosphate kinase 1 [Treponema brennaborense]MCM1470279.1 polyphosphate kinase 1 [Bacteroides sp.]